jgi:hypothetical protein
MWNSLAILIVTSWHVMNQTVVILYTCSSPFVIASMHYALLIVSAHLLQINTANIQLPRLVNGIKGVHQG